MTITHNGKRWQVMDPPKSWLALTDDPVCLTCRQSLQIKNWFELIWLLKPERLRDPSNRNHLLLSSREKEPVAIGCRCARRPLVPFAQTGNRDLSKKNAPLDLGSQRSVQNDKICKITVQEISLL
jgi:hypothetical protein